MSEGQPPSEFPNNQVTCGETLMQPEEMNQALKGNSNFVENLPSLDNGGVSLDNQANNGVSNNMRSE